MSACRRADGRLLFSKARIAAVLALGALLVTTTATAKDLGPGDLRVCDHTRCIPITNRAVLGVLSLYYWGAGTAPRAARVRVGVPAFELRFRDGQVSGIVATARLDRFRAYGFACGRFERGKWYRFPRRAVQELKRLTVGLKPLRVAASTPRSC
jgi:hypothetical protein